MANPSYRVLGDHIESVEVQFDPGAISYEQLLKVFWESHDASAVPWKRQYLSAIFPRDGEQLRLATRSREREAARRGRRIFTEIIPDARFYSAEAYHQKFALRGKPLLLKEYEAIYPDINDFVGSTAVTRVNGFVGGNGTCGELREQIDGLGLSPQGRQRLEEIVCPPGGREERTHGAACPAR
jgi:peptide-methionine (S)-S-oxide reductase